MADEDNLTGYYPRRRKWLRAVLVIVVLVAFGFVEALLWFLAIVQFFWVIFKAEPNQNIKNFAEKLIKWTSTAISFCLWKTDNAPFPFSQLPDDH